MSESRERDNSPNASQPDNRESALNERHDIRTEAVLRLPEIQTGEDTPERPVVSTLQLNEAPEGISGNDAFERVRPKNTRTGSRVLKLVLGLFLLGLIIGGGWFATSFWSWQAETSRQVVDRFSDHPVIVEQLGGVNSCSFSLFETIGPDVSEDEVIAYKIVGPERHGFIYVRSSSGNPSDAEWAGLRIGDKFWPLENE